MAERTSSAASDRDRRSEPDRTARIEAILGRVIEQREAGLAIDPGELVRSHPDLAPDLAVSLRALQEVHVAAEEAARRREAAEPGDDRGELSFLRANLPDYRILKKINYGGQGAVFQAIQLSTSRTVAIKILLEGPLATERSRLRFEREVELTSRLQHPNIVTIYDSGVIQHRHYCVMEYVEGHPIDGSVLADDLAVRDVVRLFVQVCRAVAHAHQRGVIHRDLSCANVLVDIDGQPHVLDFGLAKDLWLDEAGPASRADLTGDHVLGTAPYVSPEQAGGSDGQVDVRSDVYALGVMLYRLLTGVYPYPVPRDFARLRSHILHTRPRSLRLAIADQPDEARRDVRQIDRDLEAVVAMALAKEKPERYQSAEELASDLERWLSGEGVRARANQRHYQLRVFLRRHRAVALSSAVVALLLLVFAGVSTSLWLQTRRQRENARQAAVIAHSALDRVLTDVDSAIEPLAGGSQARERILRGIGEELAALEPLVQSDSSLDALAMNLQERLGDIAFLQGRRESALLHFGAFTASAVRVAASGDAAAVAAVVRAHRKRASASADPVPLFELSIATADGRLDSDPQDSLLRAELCESLMALGRHLLQHGQLEACAAPIRRALNEARALTETGFDPDRSRLLLATALNWTGDLQFQLGFLLPAADALREEVDLRRALQRERPVDAERRRMLLLACVKRSQVEGDLGNRELAQGLLSEAHGLGEYLLHADPDMALWRRDYLSVCLAMSKNACDQGHATEAMTFAQSSIELADQLVRLDPEKSAWKRLAAHAYLRRASAWQMLKERESALDDQCRAIAIQQALLAEEPGNDSLRSEFAHACDQAGSTCRKLRRFEESRAYYDRAYDIRLDRLRKFPQARPALLDIIVSRVRLSAWRIDQNTPEDDRVAAELLRDALAELTALRDQGRIQPGERQNQWFAAIENNLAILRGEKPRLRF